MPHAEIRHSADLDFDAEAMFDSIETTIAAADAGAGVCKCRAYAAPSYRHTHFSATVSILAKPHRDAAFTAALLSRLEAAMKAHLKQPCEFSLAITFSPISYVTNRHFPE